MGLRADSRQAGFPFFQLDRFLKTLVQDLNKYVAISEEFANDAANKVKSGLLFDRRVTRIVTPGTLVDEKFMDPYENNFLLSIYGISHESGTEPNGTATSEVEVSSIQQHCSSDPVIGLAWLDLSTGEFFTQVCTLGTLSASIVRIAPKEIVLNRQLDNAMKESIMEILGHDQLLITWQPAPMPNDSMEVWAENCDKPKHDATMEKFAPEESAAMSIVLKYVDQNLQGLNLSLQYPVRKEASENMGIDKNSMRGLEILQTSRDAIVGGKGSLLHSVRRTVTRSGARLLRERLGKSHMDPCLDDSCGSTLADE